MLTAQVFDRVGIYGSKTLAEFGTYISCRRESQNVLPRSIMRRIHGRFDAIFLTYKRKKKIILRFFIKFCELKLSFIFYYHFGPYSELAYYPLTR